jgi:signal transduction histidine kinase
LTADTLEAVRKLAVELRPATLDDLGLVAALEGYTDSYGSRMPVRVAFSAEGFDDRDDRLPPQVELVLYRVVQEALTNVAKHAGAGEVHVELRRRRDEVIAAVADDGQGFDVEDTMRSRERGLGLFGMQERLALVGGQLVIDSSPGRGTRIHARVPSSSAAAFG